MDAVHVSSLPLLSCRRSVQYDSRHDHELRLDDWIREYFIRLSQGRLLCLIPTFITLPIPRHSLPVLLVLLLLSDSFPPPPPLVRRHLPHSHAPPRQWAVQFLGLNVTFVYARHLTFVVTASLLPLSSFIPGSVPSFDTLVTRCSFLSTSAHRRSSRKASQHSITYYNPTHGGPRHLSLPSPKH
jgi:hypothetical protein